MSSKIAAADDNAVATHLVLVNQEDQYSLWPIAKSVPAGWSSVFEGTREACLAHVEEVWTDMRPKSVRNAPPQ
jgi:MbtH protein